VSQQFECDHLEAVKDIHKDMEDFIVESFSEACSEVGKGCFTRQMRHGKAGIGAVAPTLVFITEMLPKLGDVGIPTNMSEQVNEK